MTCCNVHSGLQLGEGEGIMLTAPRGGKGERGEGGIMLTGPTRDMGNHDLLI